MKKLQENHFKKFQNYFDEPILKTEILKHKGNNRLFKITLNKKKFIVKEYSTIFNEKWKRGTTEYKSMNYLWNKGFRDIPQPIKFYEKENIGIYLFKDGEVLKPEKIKEVHIDKALDFLTKVHSLNNKDKLFFNPACSACLCLQDYINVIDRRLNKIIKYTPIGEYGVSARNFLDEIIPKIERLKKDFLTKTKDLDLKKKISLDEQVLTPADFGFHNILIDNANNYTFLDFEYFGRDDPVRQLLDFVHHDRSVNIDKDLKKLFLEKYIHKTKRNLKERLEIIDPLINMTWILIYLNVLSEDYLRHVKFAHGDIEDIFKERLDKAKIKIENINFFT